MKISICYSHQMTVQVILIFAIKKYDLGNTPVRNFFVSDMWNRNTASVLILFVRQCQYNSKYFLYFKRKCKKSIFTNFDIVKCIGSKFGQLIWFRYVVTHLLRPTCNECQQWLLIAPPNSFTSQSPYTDMQDGFGHSTRTKSVVRKKVVPNNKHTPPLFSIRYRGQCPRLFKCFRENNFRWQSFALHRNTLDSLLCCTIRVGCVYKYAYS
jgi:hypothetical protein